MKFEEFSKKDLQVLRSQICLNSIFYADYRNTFGLSEKSMCDFFDSYYTYIWELAKEENPNMSEQEIEKIIGKYDNIETLWDYFSYLEDFSWVEYNEEDEENDLGLY